MQPGTQPWNSNALDPRFGTPGYAKTAQASNGPGPNNEGIYSERNDLGYNQYFNYVNGQLPAPANGTNFLNIVPAQGATYTIWVDQQPLCLDANAHRQQLALFEGLQTQASPQAGARGGGRLPLLATGLATEKLGRQRE